MLLGEVAPAAPALVPLISLALLMVAFGIVFVVRKLTDALFGWLISALEAIPAIGGALAGPFKTVEQAVANALGSAEHAIDGAMGASWHLLARYMDWLWREIRGHSTLLLQIASTLPLVGTAIAVIRSLVHHTTTTNTAQGARIKHLEREYHGIDRQLRTLEKQVRGIDETGVKAKLGSLDKELAALEAQTIPAIQQTEAQSQSAIDNLYEWIKGKASLLGVGTFATAVAAALGLSSLSGFLCNEFRNILGRGCSGLWSGLDNLLGWFVDLFFIVNLCDVIPLLETAYADVAAPAVGLLTEAIDAMPCVDGNQPAKLTVPQLYLVPDTGYTLNLP